MHAIKTLAGCALAPVLIINAAVAQVAASDDNAAPAVLAAGAMEEITVIAKRLNDARNGLSPKTGGSIYQIGESDVAALPEGANTSFNQVMLQTPGVANDSFGQLHIRGDHGNVQYRVD